MAIICVTDDPYMRDFYHWVLQGHWEGGFNPVDEGFEWNVAGGEVNSVNIGYPKSTFWYELGNNPDYLSSRKIYWYRAWHTYYEGEELIKIYGEMKQFTAINPNCTGFTNFEAKNMIRKYYSYHGGLMSCKIRTKPGTFVCEPTDVPWGPTQYLEVRAVIQGWTKSDKFYNIAHDAPTGEAPLLHVGQYKRTGAYPRYFIKRLGVIFNATALPNDCQVVSATMILVGAGDLSSTDFNLVLRYGGGIWPKDPTDMENYAFGHYYGNGGSISTSSGNYTEWVWSEEGLLWIQKEVYTRIAILSSRDIDSIEPTGEEFVKYNNVPANTEVRIGYQVPL